MPAPVIEGKITSEEFIAMVKAIAESKTIRIKGKDFAGSSIFTAGELKNYYSNIERPNVQAEAALTFTQAVTQVTRPITGPGLQLETLPQAPLTNRNMLKGLLDNFFDRYVQCKNSGNIPQLVGLPDPSPHIIYHCTPAKQIEKQPKAI